MSFLKPLAASATALSLAACAVPGGMGLTGSLSPNMTQTGSIASGKKASGKDIPLIQKTCQNAGYTITAAGAARIATDGYAKVLVSTLARDKKAQASVCQNGDQFAAFSQAK